MKKRLDQLLVEKNFFESREKAKSAIMLGDVIVNEQAITKSGTMIKDSDDLNIRIKNKLPYVSRGGLKLEKAINEWNLDFKEKIVLDIGASTGGFTDCSLQNGAKYVYSVDVGTNQLDWKLRNSKKVKSIENKHIKNLTIEDIDNSSIDYIVIDVSFISLTKVFDHLHKFINKNTLIVALIKPQFEVGKENIGKNGVVNNEDYREEAINKIKEYGKEKGFELLNISESPITGAKGNKEFLSLFKV